jgi:hypothetical protein
VTRAEFARYLVYGLGRQTETDTYKGSDKFRDVASGHWADGPIGVCAAKGYVSGTTADSYSPGANITGEQLMSMLVRAAGLAEEAAALQEEGAGWSDGYIKAAQAKGLAYPDFDPQQPATRAQCSWAVVRLRDMLR